MEKQACHTASAHHDLRLYGRDRKNKEGFNLAFRRCGEGDSFVPMIALAPELRQAERIKRGEPVP